MKNLVKYIALMALFFPFAASASNQACVRSGGSQTARCMAATKAVKADTFKEKEQYFRPVRSGGSLNLLKMKKG